MTDKELRRLSRRELLEMLIEQEVENQRLRSELEAAKAEIENRAIVLDNAGSMAEASLRLSGVFEAADAAAKQYLESIRRANGDQQSPYDQIIAEAEKKAADIVKKAELEKAQKIKETDEYWALLLEKLKVFYRAHPDVKELLESMKQDG